MNIDIFKIIKEYFKDFHLRYGKHKVLNFNEIVNTKEFYFIPLKSLHSSGFRHIKILFEKNGEIYEKSCCSDVLHFGVDEKVSSNFIAQHYMFNIDVLPSGITRFFINSDMFVFKLGLSLSDFEITIMNKDDVTIDVKDRHFEIRTFENSVRKKENIEILKDIQLIAEYDNERYFVDCFVLDPDDSDTYSISIYKGENEKGKLMQKGWYDSTGATIDEDIYEEQNCKLISEVFDTIYGRYMKEF